MMQTTYTPESAAAALAAGETTIEQIAAATGWPIVEDCLVPEPGKWHADDGNAEVESEAGSGIEAAQEYVDTGDWGEITETTWITVWAWRLGINMYGEWCEVERMGHKITLEPEEPVCIDADGHDWQAPHSIVGGIKENPGVWGHGGGVTIDEVCVRCGCGKTIDTWAQDPTDGAQGLRSVSYEPGRYEIPDEEEEEEDE
jgi:hypothetical protein